jgi:hypothetical protein
MSHRLQVLIPEELDARLRKAADRARVSKGRWVRQALERILASGDAAADPLATLANLDAPTGDIEQILGEIESGRS